MREGAGRDGGTSGANQGEVELLGRIMGGDRHAFEQLYRAYFPRLSRFLGRMTRSAALIEEVVNDTMLVVWQTAQRYDGSCKVSTWIFAIAYRKALKGLHRRDEPVEAEADAGPAPASLEPERQLSRRQLRRTLEQVQLQRLRHPAPGPAAATIDDCATIARAAGACPCSCATAATVSSHSHP
jgi:hypothetical protein